MATEDQPAGRRAVEVKARQCDKLAFSLVLPGKEVMALMGSQFRVSALKLIGSHILLL